MFIHSFNVINDVSYNQFPKLFRLANKKTKEEGNGLDR
jgi:hypothetical protein